VITSVKKTGTVHSINISPKGFYEGFLLKSGKNVVQVNLAEEHLKLVRVLDNGGRTDEPGKFWGRIERLNYALHGEVNGGILESGDFLCRPGIL
jgi:hypothetical protein